MLGTWCSPYNCSRHRFISCFHLFIFHSAIHIGFCSTYQSVVLYRLDRITDILSLSPSSTWDTTGLNPYTIRRPWRHSQVHHTPAARCSPLRTCSNRSVSPPSKKLNFLLLILLFSFTSKSRNNLWVTSPRLHCPSPGSLCRSGLALLLRPDLERLTRLFKPARLPYPNFFFILHASSCLVCEPTDQHNGY